MTLSLIAVFIPILLMAGIVGRLVPRVCRHTFGGDFGFPARFSHHDPDDVLPPLETRAQAHGRIYRINENAFNSMVRLYDRGLKWVFRHEAFTLGILLITIAVNVYLLIIVPKGFFPLGDTGHLRGGIRASQEFPFRRWSGSLPILDDHQNGSRRGHGHDLYGRSWASQHRKHRRDVEAFRRTEADCQPGD